MVEYVQCGSDEVQKRISQSYPFKNVLIQILHCNFSYIVKSKKRCTNPNNFKLHDQSYPRIILLFSTDPEFSYKFSGTFSLAVVNRPSWRYNAFEMFNRLEKKNFIQIIRSHPTSLLVCHLVIFKSHVTSLNSQSAQSVTGEQTYIQNITTLVLYTDA